MGKKRRGKIRTTKKNGADDTITEDKKVDKRLYAVQLRGERFTNPEIAEKLDTSRKVVSRWISAYINDGVKALTESRYGGNHRNMSMTEEAEFLAEYRTLAEKGQIVDVGTITSAYKAKVGHNIGNGQIYYVLHRHGWRKVIPRSKHPNKASDEEMNPIEQIWKEIRKRGFRNEIFQTLEKVIDRLCDTICSLSKDSIMSITGRDWILSTV